MSEERNRNEYLIYTIESIIDIGSRKVKNLTMFPVYKLLYLAYLKLKESGINIELPYSWYLQGTMVESTGFMYHTGGLCLSNYFCEGYTAVNVYHLSPSLSISEDEKSTITTTINTLIDAYTDHQQIQITRLIKDVYAHAPYEFQREFRFRLLGADFNSISRSGIRGMLDSLKDLFPQQQYPVIYPDYLRWDDTIRLALRLDIPNQDIKQLCKTFWQYFASAIRVRENENLIASELEQTATIEQRQKENLSAVLDEARERYLLLLDESQGSGSESRTSTLLDEINNVAYSAFVSER